MIRGKNLRDGVIWDPAGGPPTYHKKEYSVSRLIGTILGSPLVFTVSVQSDFEDLNEI